MSEFRFEKCGKDWNGDPIHTWKVYGEHPTDPKKWRYATVEECEKQESVGH